MTKDIQLCAIGNGIVDLQFYISEDEIDFRRGIIRSQ